MKGCGVEKLKPSANEDEDLNFTRDKKTETIRIVTN